MPITAIIPCFNEEKKIETALASVAFADEILVVDSFSTDGTLELAKKYGARIIQREYGYSADQKNWAIPQAKNEWIVLLDADEWLSEELQMEIKNVVASNPSDDGFWIKRENIFMGRRMRFGQWRGDKVIRLFHRDRCRYEDKRVHAEIICEGSTGLLKGKISHDTYRGFSAMIQKADRYTTWKAADRLTGKKIGWFDLVIKPGFAFFREYFLQLGFLDGYPGFISANHSGWTKFVRAVKIMRMQKGEVFVDPQTGKTVK
ncbi:MAG: glycosyltransferase family 2 protein [Cryomorphaceae bacterium]|nr:glycosyltransferase family 2 protein [Cryomorphaceae bacterium]